MAINDIYIEGDENIKITLTETGYDEYGYGPAGKSYFVDQERKEANVLIVDDEPEVTVWIDSTQNGTEDGQNGYFRLKRDNTDRALTVHYELDYRNGSYCYDNYEGWAKNGTDFQQLPGTSDWENYGTIIFAIGQQYVDIPIIVFDDNLTEGTENVKITLRQYSYYDYCSPGVTYFLDAEQSTATLSILDNETPVTVWIDSTQNAVENGQAGYFRLRRSNTSGSMTVWYDLNPNNNSSDTPSGWAKSDADFNWLSNTHGSNNHGWVTFQNGQEYVDIVVTPKNDSWIEGTEIVEITLSNLKGDGGGERFAIDPLRATAQVSILDDEVPVTVSIDSVQNGAEGGSNGYFRLYRDVTAGALTVWYSLDEKNGGNRANTIGWGTNGLDFSYLPGTSWNNNRGSVTFADGQAYVDIPVTITDDARMEGTESVRIRLEPNTSGTTYLIDEENIEATLTIADNESVVNVWIDDSGDGTEGGSNGYVTIKRDVTTTSLLVYFQIDSKNGGYYDNNYAGWAKNGTDFQWLAGTNDYENYGYFTFAAGQATYTLPINVIDDNWIEGTELLAFSLLQVHPYYDYGEDSDIRYLIDPETASATVSIYDNEIPVTVWMEKIRDGEEGGQNGLVRFHRDDTINALTVYYELDSRNSGDYYSSNPEGWAKNGTDFQWLPGTSDYNNYGYVTFAAGQSYVDVSITVVDDSYAEGTEQINLTLTQSQGCYYGCLPGVTYLLDEEAKSVSVSIVDNDEVMLVSAGGPYECILNGNITLSASIINDPGGLGGWTYQWDLDDDGVFETSGQSVMFGATGLAAGIHSVGVKAIDGEGNIATDTATVAVVVPVPILGVTLPDRDNQEVLPSQTVSFSFTEEGDPQSIKIRITNTGNCTLTLDWQNAVLPSGISVQGTPPPLIAADGFSDVIVSWNGNADLDGMFTVSTNDPNYAAISIRLVGETVPVNVPATLISAEMLHWTGETNVSTADPTVIGQVSNDGSLEGLTVEAWSNNTFVGTAVTDSEGNFVLRPIVLSYGPTTLQIRVKEWNSTKEAWQYGNAENIGFDFLPSSVWIETVRHGNENGESGTVRINRDNTAVESTVWFGIDYASTAVNGVDYRVDILPEDIMHGYVVLEVGQSFVDIDVEIFDDAVAEGPEYVRFYLHESEDYEFGNFVETFLTIHDDDVRDDIILKTDAFVVHSGGTIDIQGIGNGLFVNDIDANTNGMPGTDSGRAALVVGPTNGTLTLNDDGTFFFEAESGYVGTDSFTYKYVFNDGTETAAAHVLLNVVPETTAPVVPGGSNAIVSVTTAALDFLNDEESSNFVPTVIVTGSGDDATTTTRMEIIQLEDESTLEASVVETVLVSVDIVETGDGWHYTENGAAVFGSSGNGAADLMQVGKPDVVGISAQANMNTLSMDGAGGGASNWNVPCNNEKSVIKNKWDNNDGNGTTLKGHQEITTEVRDGRAVQTSEYDNTRNYTGATIVEKTHENITHTLERSLDVNGNWVIVTGNGTQSGDRSWDIANHPTTTGSYSDNYAGTLAYDVGNDSWHLSGGGGHGSAKANLNTTEVISQAFGPTSIEITNTVKSSSTADATFEVVNGSWFLDYDVEYTSETGSRSNYDVSYEYLDEYGISHGFSEQASWNNTYKYTTRFSPTSGPPGQTETEADVSASRHTIVYEGGNLVYDADISTNFSWRTRSGTYDGQYVSEHVDISRNNSGTIDYGNEIVEFQNGMSPAESWVKYTYKDCTDHDSESCFCSESTGSWQGSYPGGSMPESAPSPVWLSMNTTSSELPVPGAFTTPTAPAGIAVTPPTIANSVCLPARQGVFSGRNRLNVEGVTKSNIFDTSHEDDPLGPKKSCRVLQTYENGLQNIVKLYLKVVETGREFFVRTSVGHRLYVLDHGFEHAQDVPIGARMINYNQQVVEVLAVELEPEPELVYNFEVEEAHTYFVGDDAECCVLGHNEDCGKCDSKGVKDIFTAVVVGANAHAYTIYGVDCPHCFINEMTMGQIKNNSVLIHNIPHILSTKTGIVTWESKWLSPAIFGTSRPSGNSSGAGGGEHIFVGCTPGSPLYVGTQALGPCIGVLIYCPNEGVRAAFHFNSGNAAASTLAQYNWPKGAKAIIAGGDNTCFSNAQLYEVISQLKKEGIQVDGVIPAEGLWCDRDGNWGIFDKDMHTKGEFKAAYPNASSANPPKMITVSKSL